MEININYIVVEQVPDPVSEGFKIVEVQDSFVYKGRIKQLPATPVHLCNKMLEVGEVVIFAKYSPDTFEIDLPNGKVKFVKITDLLAVL